MATPSPPLEDILPLASLDAEPWPCFVVNRDGAIVYTNAAWDRVAARAAGPPASRVLGTSWLDCVAAPELAIWYTDLFHRLMTGLSRGERHLGDCNTPDRRRVFSTRYDALRPLGAPAPSGMLALNSLVAEMPISDTYTVARPDEVRYRQANGLLLQCGGCRRVHVAGTAPRVWELVPEYLEEPRRDVSHGLCELCREIHYGVRELRAS